MASLRNLIKIDDSLKQKRIEWAFGVPTLKFRKATKQSNVVLGLEMTALINEEVYKFPSYASMDQNDGILS